MSLYQKTFPDRHTFLAVVHSEDREQTMRNVAIAHDCGAHGVFLINHSIRSKLLVELYEEARAVYPNFWMGMNILNQDPISAINMMPDTHGGLWVDNAGIIDTGATFEAEQIRSHRVTSVWDGLYFGGVAFKYQKPVHNVARVARLSRPFVDVVTTSGEGTGEAAAVEKIRLMSEALEGYPLAIASGITPENVHEYMPYAQCFLVATCVSDSHTELNGPRVRKLANILRH